MYIRNNKLLNVYGQGERRTAKVAQDVCDMFPA